MIRLKWFIQIERRKVESVPGISGNIASFITSWRLAFPGRFLESNSLLSLDSKSTSPDDGKAWENKADRWHRIEERMAGTSLSRRCLSPDIDRLPIRREGKRILLSPILSPVQVRRGSVQSAVGDDIHSSSMNLSKTPISV